MLDLMFELPDLVKDKKDFLITEEMVLGSEPITEMVNLKRLLDLSSIIFPRDGSLKASIGASIVVSGLFPIQ